MPGLDGGSGELPMLDAVVRRRRTCLQLDVDREVAPATIRELCELATWAPNHHRTEPWRFAVFTGEGRGTLGHTIAGVLAAAGAPAPRVAKARVKYLRAPAMVLVGSIGDDDPMVAEENRYAVAAAVQTLLLAATARGLGSFWSSPATPTAPALLDLCGFDATVTVVAAVYLGHPTGTCPTPPRADPEIRWTA